MPKLDRPLIAAAALFLAAAVPAFAAPGDSHTFLEARLSQHHDDMRYDFSRVAGATWGRGISFGRDWGRKGLEIAVTVPDWYTTAHTSRYQYNGTLTGLEQPGHTYESIETSRHRSIDVAVYYRSSAPLVRRVTFTWLIGAAQVYRPERIRTTLNDLLPDGSHQVYDIARHSSRDYLAGAARLDLTVTISRHLSAGPRLAMTIFPSALDDSGSAPRQLVARPEIALRWTF